MKIQFFAGEGNHFRGGVNYLIGSSEHFEIYAEVPVPENAAEDYGYLRMKEAIVNALPSGEQLSFPYDGQESFLSAEAMTDCEVYLDIQMNY